MSVTHNLSFSWGQQVTQAVTLTGQIEGNASEVVNPLAANKIAMAWTNAKLQEFSLFSDQALTVTTNGTQQVETATIVAASGCTGNGTVTITVTSAILPGSPVAYAVPMTTASNTAALVAAVCRAYLLTQAPLTALYVVGGTGATISLTALLPAANDSSLNIASADGSASGITTEASSSHTTAGVAVQDTLTIGAAAPFVWYAGSGITNPFSGNVTSITATNYGATLANLTIKSLVTSP